MRIGGRQLASAIAAVVVVALLGAWAAGAFSSRAGVHQATASGTASDGQATVTVSTAVRGPKVAADFMGLSFEASAIPLLAQYGNTGNLAALMRSLGKGVLRLGGDSADAFVAWHANKGGTPRWAHTVISPSDLAGIAALSKKSGWRVLLTVNLGHYDPAAAAQEAAAANRLLGADLEGIEIGNEPDRYAREGLRGQNWSFAEYKQQYMAYRKAIAHAAPGVSIVAPDASSGIPPLPWVQAAAVLDPTLVTDHYYPLSSCGGFRVHLAELLSPALRTQESTMLGRLLKIERASGERLRLDETNDVSCRGQAGVSNTLASALWAVDWTERAMQVGLAGLNFHDLLTEPLAYSPLVLPPSPSPAPSAAQTTATNTHSSAGGLAAASLHANPEWYALLLTSQLVGSQPLPTRVKGGAELSAGAFLESKSRGAPMRLALVDFDESGASSVRVHLHVPAGYVAGSVLPLTGPSTGAAARILLGGTEVGASGTWAPKLPLAAVSGTAGSLSVTMAPSSAALVTLHQARRR